MKTTSVGPHDRSMKERSLWRRFKRGREKSNVVPPNQFAVQVCPRCPFYEKGIRRFEGYHRWFTFSRTEVVVESVFSSTCCPDCGLRLEAECPKCGTAITNAWDSHCRGCGGTFRWAATRKRSGQRVLASDWRALATKPLETLDGDTDVWVMETDITTLRIDAIVASDDTSGRMRGNAAGAIKRVGGNEIEDESVAQGPFKQGSAWSTGAGSLAVRWIIHVAATDHADHTTKEVIGASTRNCLREADKLDVQEIAFPAVGAGVAGIPIDESASAMMSAIKAHHAEEGGLRVKDIIFVVYGEESLREFNGGLGVAPAP
jgi:O-acetyl-ADP-ribose deacetylase